MSMTAREALIRGCVLTRISKQGNMCSIEKWDELYNVIIRQTQR